MATNDKPNANGQTPEEARIALALELLAAQEVKDAEKERKRQERAAEKAAKGEEPNAAHTWTATLVRAVRAANLAYADDDAAFRAYVTGQLAGMMDTFAGMSNLTTSTDARVIGQLIETTMPKVPVAQQASE